MGTIITSRGVNAVQVLIICTELVLSCVCAVMLIPPHGEFWRQTTTPVQMVATGGLGVVDIGRLVALLIDRKLPLLIECLYLGISAVLFATSAGLAVASNASSPDFVFDEQFWIKREGGRAIVAFFTLALLIADGAATCLRASRENRVLEAIHELDTVTPEEEPPLYVDVVGSKEGGRGAN